MKLSFSWVAGLLVIAFLAGASAASFFSFGIGESAPVESVPYSSIQTAFCPSAECTALPIAALDSARSRVWVAMYSFTNQDFADALIRAHARGVDVRVIVEKQQAGSQYSQHVALSTNGISVRIDSNPNFMHNKFAVIDSEKLINGSMNWTGNGVGENNENVLVIASPELNSKFADEFQKIWNESDAFVSN